MLETISLPENMEELTGWSRPDLVRLWEHSLGSSPPRGTSQPLLARLLAYDLQCRKKKLPPRVQNRLQKLAHGEADKLPTAKLKPGARLLREWNGLTHVVDIRDDGVYYRDKKYRSLSAIAKAITGSHWSGPRFFGLVNRGGAA